MNNSMICPECNGDGCTKVGEVREWRNHNYVTLSQYAACAICGGEGYLTEKTYNEYYGVDARA